MYTNRCVGFWRRRYNKGHESLGVFFLWRARSQNLWLQRDKRPEEESSIPDRPEGLSHGSARSSYLFPTASKFFFPIYPLFAQVGHSIRGFTFIELIELSLPGCHLVTLRRSSTSSQEDREVRGKTFYPGSVLRFPRKVFSRASFLTNF